MKNDLFHKYELLTAVLTQFIIFIKDNWETKTNLFLELLSDCISLKQISFIVTLDEIQSDPQDIQPVFSLAQVARKARLLNPKMDHTVKITTERSN